MLDDKEYLEKPQDFNQLNSRLIQSPVEMNIATLANELVKGKTFCPAYFQKKNGKIQRREDYWYSQEIIALDFDKGMTITEALQEFSTTASFLYTSFSHTQEQHKFRVVFILDTVITNFQECKKIIDELLKKYPLADQKCFEPHRMYFGGKILHEISFNNRLHVAKTNIFQQPQNGNINVPSIVDSSRRAKNVSLIKNQNIMELQALIKPIPITLANNMEIYDYLKRQDLRKLLGLPLHGNFLDIFHIESNPSSSIFESNKDNRHQLYKCFSERAPFVGTIFEVITKLLNISRVEAKRFLMKLYCIELKENELQKNLKEEIDAYKEILMSEDLEELYPMFYKVFSKYGYLDDLYILLDLIKEYLPSGEDKRLLFHQSIETISKLWGRSKSVTGTRMNFLAFFKVINKLEISQTPSKLQKKQLEAKKRNHYKYHNSTYEINMNSVGFFENLNKMCTEWVAKGCTQQIINYEGIQRNFGTQEANRVFPQDKGREIPVLNQEVADRIRNVILNLIADQGYAIKKDILSNIILYFKGQKKFKEKELAICLGEILEDYGLEKVHLNNGLKKLYGIEVPGYPVIIKPKKDL